MAIGCVAVEPVFSPSRYPNPSKIAPSKYATNAFVAPWSDDRNSDLR